MHGLIWGFFRRTLDCISLSFVLASDYVSSQDHALGVTTGLKAVGSVNSELYDLFPLSCLHRGWEWSGKKRQRTLHKILQCDLLILTLPRRHFSNLLKP